MAGGNPFKPKPQGYSSPDNPALQLLEVTGRIVTSLETVWSTLSRLAASMRNADRDTIRIGLMAAAVAGPRSAIPYDSRDLIRDAGRSGGRRFAANPGGFING